MGFEVKLHPEAVKYLKSLEPETQERIKASLRLLGEDPFKKRSGADIKKLKGTKGRKDLYRLRIGSHRAVYAVEEDTVWITEIFHRERGYR